MVVVAHLRQCLSPVSASASVLMARGSCPMRALLVIFFLLFKTIIFLIVSFFFLFSLPVSPWDSYNVYTYVGGKKTPHLILILDRVGV